MHFNSTEVAAWMAIDSNHFIQDGIAVGVEIKFIILRRKTVDNV